MPERSRLPTWGLAVLLVVALVVVGLALRTKTSPASDATLGRATVTHTIDKSKPLALWIGDSYTAGTGAKSQSRAESCLTSRAIGYRCALDAVAGSGFLAHVPGTLPVPARLATDKDMYKPSLVVLDAGRNDHTGFSVARVESVAAQVIAELRADFPDAPLVLIAPYYMTSTSEPLGQGYVEFLDREASITSKTFVIDPIGEGWIGNAESGKLVISDDIHPDQAGHDYIAQHLEADFRSDNLAASTS